MAKPKDGSKQDRDTRDGYVDSSEPEPVPEPEEDGATRSVTTDAQKHDQAVRDKVKDFKADDLRKKGRKK